MTKGIYLLLNSTKHKVAIYVGSLSKVSLQVSCAGVNARARSRLVAGLAK